MSSLVNLKQMENLTKLLIEFKKLKNFFVFKIFKRIMEKLCSLC